MSFSVDMAKLIADQLARFVSLNRHQLAGQAANLDFWLAQVRHGLEVLDGYGQRFQRLKAAQAKHVAKHHTTAFHLDDPCCTSSAPDPPQRIRDAEIRDARRSLCEAVYRLLIRCQREGFIEESALRAACNHLGIGVNVADLKRKRR